MKTQNYLKCDIVVIGGGPAGISAAIYAARAGRKVVVIEKYAPGGQLNLIGEVENYAGFKKISGAVLAQNFEEHARSLGVIFVMDEVASVAKSNNEFVVKTNSSAYKALSLILAGGCHSRELGIEGEQKFKGRGVSYCALCDGNFFKGKRVAVVGSGDSAFSDADYLASICKKVFVLTKAKLKLHNYAENELDNKDNVTMLRDALSTRILGQDKLEKLEYVQNGQRKTIDVDGVFVAIGRSPDTALLKDFVQLSDGGYVKSNDKMETSVAGVFVCGDVRDGSIRQIATAVGDGAIAGTNANKYVLLKKFKG